MRSTVRVGTMLCPLPLISVLFLSCFLVVGGKQTASGCPGRRRCWRNTGLGAVARQEGLSWLSNKSSVHAAAQVGLCHGLERSRKRAAAWQCSQRPRRCQLRRPLRRWLAAAWPCSLRPRCRPRRLRRLQSRGRQRPTIPALCPLSATPVPPLKPQAATASSRTPTPGCT